MKNLKPIAAEDPERYVIIGRYRGNAEVIDTAKNLQSAQYLCGEYALAYGSEWSVSYRRKRKSDD